MLTIEMVVISSSPEGEAYNVTKSPKIFLLCYVHVKSKDTVQLSSLKWVLPLVV